MIEICNYGASSFFIKTVDPFCVEVLADYHKVRNRACQPYLLHGALLDSEGEISMTEYSNVEANQSYCLFCLN